MFDMWKWLGCCLVALSLLGCGAEEENPAATGAPEAKQSLEDLASLLKYCGEQKRALPRAVADIEPIEPLFQAAYLGLARNDIVYVWGANLNPAASDKVLAYEKAVESSTGWVLLQDGTLKSMPAAEFTALTKATQ